MDYLNSFLISLSSGLYPTNPSANINRMLSGNCVCVCVIHSSAATCEVAPLLCTFSRGGSYAPWRLNNLPQIRDLIMRLGAVMPTSASCTAIPLHYRPLALPSEPQAWRFVNALCHRNLMPSLCADHSEDQRLPALLELSD